MKSMMNLRSPLAAMLLAVTLFATIMITGTNLRAQSPQQQWVGDLPIMAGMTIEPELGFALLGIRTVAMKTSIRENGTNVPIKL